MTTIVAVRCSDRIVMGGDSAGCNSSGLVELRSDPKVFKRDGYLMGYTTSFRMGQILRYWAELPEPSKSGDLHAFMVRDFIPAIRDAYLEHGFAKTFGRGETKGEKNYSESGQAWGGQFLVGVRESLFIVHEDFQVGEPLLPHFAIGSGALVAFGALFATADLAPEERVQIALESAVEHTSCVRPPFVLGSIP